jgi:PAS domain S-box-containing protein
MEVAVEHAREPILITDADLDDPGPTIRFANRAFTEMSGYEEEELIGNTPQMLQGPETDDEKMAALGRALRNGETWSGETMNYRKDGTAYRVRWRVAPVRIDGEIEYWISYQRDVTDEA